MSEQDSFYEEEAYQDEDLDEILNQPVDEDEMIQAVNEETEWELSEEEEGLYKRLQAKVQRQDMILKTFAALEEKPSEEDITDFKAKHGEAYLVSLSEKENFIFRPLKRQEWRNLMQQTSKLDEYKKSEAIAIRGVVWPQLNNMNVGSLAAGTVDTLRDLVLEASNFMTPDRAVQLVRKL